MRLRKHEPHPAGAFSIKMSCQIQSSAISEQYVDCQKLDDQENGAHGAPKGIASPILADIFIGLECLYPEPFRVDPKANGDRHRGWHDCIRR